MVEKPAEPTTSTPLAATPTAGQACIGMIIGISTPHKKSGLLYTKWREH